MDQQESPATIMPESMPETVSEAAPETALQTSAPGEGYQETDIFQWANNLVQYVDDLKIDLYFFNKN